MNYNLLPKGRKSGSHLTDQKPVYERKARHKKKTAQKSAKSRSVKWI